MFAHPSLSQILPRMNNLSRHHTYAHRAREPMRGSSEEPEEITVRMNGMLLPNETQDQRLLARAGMAASKVWKSSKARTRSAQRFAASHG